MQQTVRKKRKKSMEEKIKSNQMKILPLKSFGGDSRSSQPFVLTVGEREPSLGVIQSCEMSPASISNRRRLFKMLKLTLVLLFSLAGDLLSPGHNLATKSGLSCDASTLSDFDGATFYKAPVGSRVRIACNASHWNDDSISLVLWFKGNPTGAAAQLQPIYTIDARQKPLSSGQARHLVADSFKGRARFVFPQQQQPNQPASNNNSTLVPYLDLAPIEADDQAEYRCRVDYRSRPRENFLIILFVLVPPSSVEIADANGRALEQIYGPLNEGSDLRLVCLSKGGRPPPAIVWKQAGHVIDDSYLTLNDFLTLKLANGSGLARASLSGSNSSLSLFSAGQQQQVDNNLAPVHHKPALQSADDNQTMGPFNVPEQKSDHRQQSDSNKLADWLAWPEFNYFHQSELHQHANWRQTGNHIHVDQATRHQQTTTMGHHHQSQSAQLIDLQVDASTTTGVNVLHLNELTRAHLADEWQAQPEDAVAVGRRRRPDNSQGATTVVQATPMPGARLECHASNAHYDLHSLIKLFAPPSLQELAQSNENDTNSTGAVASSSIRPAGRNNSPATTSSSSSELAQAIERAIWANLKSSSAQAESNELHESQPPSSARVSVAHLHRQQQHHQQQQQQPEDAPSAVASVARSRPSLGHEPNWPLVIQQQLIRPHQLVSAAELSSASSSSSSASEPPQANQTNAKPSQLSRSKLIALEANLRPLDVRITSPGRPLLAGQVHEFTCQSSGSRPPAKLSWLKDGRRLEPKLARQFNGGQTTPPPTDAEAYKLSGEAWSASASSSTLISQSRLTIRLEREDHNARLSCRAENDQYKRAKSVRQRFNTTAMHGDYSSEAGRQQPNSSAAMERNDHDQDSPNNDDHENDNDQNWQLEDSLTLNVHYVPRVRLELGNKMLSERIREGQDIYFVCRCDSNPTVNEITWLHNDRPINDSQPLQLLADGANAIGKPSQSAKQLRLDSLSSSFAAGSLNGSQPPANLIVSNDSLVLQRVQIEQSGQYNCLASNSEGVGLSNQIELRVQHAPICVATVAESGLQTADNRQEKLVWDANGQPALSLGSFRLPSEAGQSLRLACQMLVPDEQQDHDDATTDQQHQQQQQLDQLEFTWYLNNSFNERRLLARQTSREGGVKLIDARQSDLLGLPWHPPPASSVVRPLGSTRGSPSGSLAAAGNKSQARKTSRVAVAYLNLNWNLAAGIETQTGQLFCLARNSVGEQRRACLYTIEPFPRPNERSRSSADNNSNDVDDATAADDDDANRRPPPFACLSVNVTSSSAWIGCDSSDKRGHLATSHNDQKQQQSSQLEITQVEENNDRLRPALVSASGGEFRFRFNVLVFSLPDLALDQSETNTASEPFSRQLEANLSSGLLDEPLFAVVNLRPNTKYLLEIDDLSQLASRARLERHSTTVSLRTPAMDSGQQKDHLATNHSEQTGARGQVSRPSIRQVTEPHGPDLLAAALISTRSASATAANQQQQQIYHSAGDHTSRLLQQRQTNRQQSMWNSMTDALAQLVGIQDSTSVGEQRSLARGNRRPQTSPRTNENSQIYLAKLINFETDSLIALCVCLLLLLAVVTLISLFVFRRSRFCGRRRESRRRLRADQYEVTKLGELNCNGKNKPGLSDSDADDGDQENNDDCNGDEQKRRPSVSSSVSSLTTPPKMQFETDKTTKNSVMMFGGGQAAPGRKFENHHYSTLNSRLAQHPAATNTVVGHHQPTINFLKSSSIASASATMQRNDWRASLNSNQRQQYQLARQYLARESPGPSAVMLMQATDRDNANGLNQHQHHHHQGQSVATVTRSRSSLGFGSDIAELARCGLEPNTALVLLAQMQTNVNSGTELTAAAPTTTTRHRLMQSSDATSTEKTSLLAEELQSGKWLINDANFPFSTETTTTNSGETEGERQQQQHQQQQRESWPYIEIKTSNQNKLNNIDQERNSPAAIYGGYGSSRPSKLSPTNDCCDDENNNINIEQSQCNCNELSLKLANCDVKTTLNEQITTCHQLDHQNIISSFAGDVCCPSSHHHHHQQQCSNFIELLPNNGSDSGFNEQSTIIAYDHHHDQQAYNMPDRHRSIETPATIMPTMHQRLHDRQYHHVIFNQSLNSSSIGSPPTNNQFGLSPLGSLTNTTPPNTDSYQNNNNNNMLLVSTSDDHQTDGGDFNCRLSKRDGRLSEVASNTTNTSNYSSDGFSPVAASSVQTIQKSTVKPRLASILKNCNHTMNDAPTQATRNSRPTTNDQSGVVRDNED